MSYLDNTKKLLSIVGIRLIPKEKLPSFLQNSRIVINIAHIALVAFSFVTFNVSVLFFLLFDATSFPQFSEAVLFYVVFYLHLSFYSISIWKRLEILSFMDDFEKIIEKSELKIRSERTFLSNFEFFSKVVKLRMDPMIWLINNLLKLQKSEQKKRFSKENL